MAPKRVKSLYFTLNGNIMISVGYKRHINIMCKEPIKKAIQRDRVKNSRKIKLKL